ncbi:MAG: hypothetical protein LBJ84_05445 [Oscillospiraceae bacterium]|jgi:hypothetical protein|nr:hypothetical protein [Oscillospiraceae bacterium]
MATSTFDKEIIIGDEAADRLIAILNEPAPPRPDASTVYRMLTKEDMACFLQKHSEKLSAPNSKVR